MAAVGAEAGWRAAIHRKLRLHRRGRQRQARRLGQRTRLRLREPEHHGIPILESRPRPRPRLQAESLVILESRPRPRPRLQAESLVILTLGASHWLLCRLQLRGRLSSFAKLPLSSFARSARAPLPPLPPQQRLGLRRPIVLTA